MGYKETLNLPKTDFSMKANLSVMEPRIEAFWQERDIYGTLRKKYEGKDKYILHDGPPYANGDIHMGHALNKILKDIIVKYKSMQGFDAPYVPGWDCHGLPIEHKVAEQLSKENLTLPEIRQRCRQYALHFIQVQKEQFKRLGVFGHWEDPYLTLSPDYCTQIIASFAKMVKDGYIYKSLKPVYWCSSCSTALAEAEVEYTDSTTPSICVKFPVISSNIGLPQTAAVLIWTTTPWTLPANLAIAFHPELEYAGVKIGQETLILASDLLEETMTKGGIKDYEVVNRFSGRQLEGIVCHHPFMPRQSVGVLAEYVTKDQGTGCVHIAPGHGLEDYEVGLKYNLPILAPVDNRGRFTQDVPDFEGQMVFKANKGIIEKLSSLGYLFYQEEMAHSYPHCWRCKKPVIFRATEQWFISLQANNLKDRALKAVKEVKWVPEFGEDRFYNTLESRADWCISRQRAWGVPIIAFTCLDCSQYLLDSEIISRIANLVAQEGMDVWFEKSMEELFPEGLTCKHCGSNNLKRENDILDVWFDSGVSHQAVLKQRPLFSFPADLYLEGSDQHRGWFQSALLTSMMIEDKPPYKSVLTHGFMLDKDGKAMSKSMGNVISPSEIIQQYGADILRLWVISEDYRYDVRLGNEILQQMSDSYRKIRNTWRFMLSNLYDFNPQTDKIDYQNLMELDQWVLSRLNRLIEDVTQDYESFEFHLIYHQMINFCSVELSGIYLDIVKDRLYTFSVNSQERRACQSVLYEILTSLMQMMAPILSFTSEEAWQCLLGKKEESIHLSSFPKHNPLYANQALEKRWERLLEVRSKVLIALEQERKKGNIGSSLEAKVMIKAGDQEKEVLSSYQEHLNTLFIVSQVELAKDKITSDYQIGWQEDDLLVGVKRAEGNKCLRCWNYSPRVGENSEHPELCQRCITVVGCNI